MKREYARTQTAKHRVTDRIRIWGFDIAADIKLAEQNINIEFRV